MSFVDRVLLPGFDGTDLPPWVERRLREGLAGVCLFAPNIRSSEGLRALTDAVRAASPRALVAVDEEGGDVTRLHATGGSPFPGNALLGRLHDVDLTARVARAVARQLRAAGCNLNLAPCLDVNCDPSNPVIGVRSFGADADRVARHGAAWVAAHQAAGVAACAKHFPGHGDTDVDSHHGLPVVRRDVDELLERELVPFAAAVDAGCWSVMTGHLLLPLVDPGGPATYSSVVVDGLLRDRLGFSGVVVSDALDMSGADAGSLGRGAVRALAAGCDLLCLGAGTTEEQVAEVEAEVEAAVRVGRLPRTRVELAAERVAALADRVSPPSDAVPAEAHLDPARLAACFDLTEHARTVLADRSGSPVTLVRLEATVDAATGPTPWGPFAVVGRGSPGVRVVDAGPDLAAADVPVGDVVLVGRGNHRHAWVRELVDACRHRDPRVLVVDMGWPDEGRRYADVATFGGSRLVGETLLEVLGCR